jgi:PKHD-type hydroxylase
MLVKNLYWYVEDGMPIDMCNDIVKKCVVDRQQEIMDAQVGIPNDTKTDHKIRKTNITILNPEGVLAEMMEAAFFRANREAEWLFNISNLEPIQIAQYAEGCFYDWHEDSYPAQENGMQRKLSLSVQLSDPKDYVGGDFILGDRHGSNNVLLPKKQGAVFVFPSFIPHTVTPITKGERYSAVGWMNGLAFR